MVQKLNPNAVPWDKIPPKDLDILAEKIVESLVKRFGPDTTLGELSSALDYKSAVNNAASTENSNG